MESQPELAYAFSFLSKITPRSERVRAGSRARNDGGERARVIYEFALSYSAPITAFARAATALVYCKELLRSNHSACSSGGAQWAESTKKCTKCLIHSNFAQKTIIYRYIPTFWPTFGETTSLERSTYFYERVVVAVLPCGREFEVFCVLLCTEIIKNNSYWQIFCYFCNF